MSYISRISQNAYYYLPTTPTPGEAVLFTVLGLGALWIFRSSVHATLMHACKHNSLTLAKITTALGANPTSAPWPSNNFPEDIPLHTAALFKNAQMVSFLVDKGANVNHRDRSRNSALHWACLVNAREIENAYKNKWRSQEKKSMSVEEYTVRNLYWGFINFFTSSIEKVTAHVTKNINPSRDIQENETVKIVKTLLKNRALAGHRNADNKTPLDFTCVAFNPLNIPIIKVLIKKGKADLHILDSNGISADEHHSHLKYRAMFPKNFQVNLPSQIPMDIADRPNFPKFICPLSGRPVLDPILSPIDGKTIYERSELQKLLSLNIQTFNFLFNELIELGNLRQFIQERFYEELQLRNVPFEPQQKPEEKKPEPPKLLSLLKIAVTTPDMDKRLELLRKLVNENQADRFIPDDRGKTLADYPDPPPACANANELPHEIPQEWEKDETYPAYCCPISCMLIRDPVLDPTDGKTIYERAFIYQSLENKPFSPITRQPLTEKQLIELPNLSGYIQRRLSKVIKPNQGISFVKPGFLNKKK